MRAGSPVCMMTLQGYQLSIRDRVDLHESGPTNALGLRVTRNFPKKCKSFHGGLPLVLLSVTRLNSWNLRFWRSDCS